MADIFASVRSFYEDWKDPLLQTFFEERKEEKKKKEREKTNPLYTPTPVNKALLNCFSR
jgi:hypothetical protein